MPSFASPQLRRFASQGAAHRAHLWKVVITLAAATTPTYAVAKSPTQATRTADELRGGYIERAIATFLIPVALKLTPALGTEFTIRESTLHPEEVSTRWRVFDLLATGAGEETRCVCFRLD